MKTKISVKTILLLSTISFLSYSLSAQKGLTCQNLDFSQQNFNYWVCKIADSRFSNFVTAYQCLTWTGNTAIKNRHTIMTNMYEYDCHTCNEFLHNLKLVPDGFHQSARIGNDSTYCQADAIIYEMTVDSNNALLLLHFAVVFQDPGHPPEAQPYFELRIQDVNGTLVNVPCNSYAIACASDIPGFLDCNFNHWRDWTTVGVNLFSLIGQTVYIVVATADCGYGGHYGYGYVVGECRPMKIDIQYCEGTTSARLIAPEGFVYYEWHKQNGDIIGFGKDLYLQNPVNEETYNVTMTSEIGCNSILFCVTKKTLITPDFIIDSLTNICYPTKVHLAQTAYASSSDISYWEWNISKITENQGTEYMSGDSALTYEFQDTGYYKISFTVYTENGCSDTASAIVYSYPAPDVLITAPDLICKYTETEIFATGATTYQWGGVKRKLSDTSAIIDRGGMYTVKGSDKSGCINNDTVNVEDLEFNIEYTTTDNPCFGYNTGSIKITKIIGNYVAPLFHFWKDLGYARYANGMSTDNRNKLATGFYIVYSKDDYGCFRYDTIIINGPKEKSIEADFLADSYNAATNTMITLTDNTKGNPIIWLWDLDNGNTESDSVARVNFTKEGNYNVNLYVEDSNGCFDSITKRIYIYDESTIYIPNAFTPNGDGINDIFKPKILVDLKEGYVFEIFNRLGQKVFSTTDTENGWDGKIGGKPVTTTTIYSYRIVARDFTGQDHEYVGHVTLIK